MRHGTIIATLLAGIGLTATASSPNAITWDYPALENLCLLKEGAATNGVSGAYPLHATVDTKFGKWTCTNAVVSQNPVKMGGVWVAK